jgi:hypothetical protein
MKNMQNVAVSPEIDAPNGDHWTESTLIFFVSHPSHFSPQSLMTSGTFGLHQGLRHAWTTINDCCIQAWNKSLASIATVPKRRKAAICHEHIPQDLVFFWPA